jgi:LCP family protein required for cell wall assembly
MDYVDTSNSVARTDTIILATVIPLEPYVGLLSIPRDLWVPIPGFGENRINTAHFFAEANRAGTGPYAAMQTIQQNFGVHSDYFMRIRFEGFRAVVDAMGGVDIVLEEPMAGYDAGRHHLSGSKALAFARNRLGSDDFFRMERGQLLIKAIMKQMLLPNKWLRIPGAFVAFASNVHTNIPVWMWPRLGLAVIRAGVSGFDSRTVDREMATPFTTAEGASVLIPDWSQIHPLVAEMFGE